MQLTFPRVVLVGLALVIAAQPSEAQQQSRQKQKVIRNTKQKAAVPVVAPGGLVEPSASLDTSGVQEDFPAVCVTAKGQSVVAFVAYDGTADTLELAQWTDGKLVRRGNLSEPGNVYQPSLAEDGNGTVWCIWSQMVDRHWNIYARPTTDGRIGPTTECVADSSANDVFPNAKADRQGRVWVVWQSFQGGCPDVFSRYYDPTTGAWSQTIRVTRHEAGDWEPRLAFGAADEALVVFDSYRNGNFDVFLARVSPDGNVRLAPVVASKRYEARAAAAASPDGKTLWVAYEDGTRRWGKDLGSEWRKFGGGLHYDRHLYLASVDLKSGKVSQRSDITPLIPGLWPSVGTPTTSSVNLPELAVDRQGNPWLAFRYLVAGRNGFWQAGVTKYDLQKESWTEPRTFAQSTYCLDRRPALAMAPDGALVAVWPSDGRSSKQQGDSGVFLARIDTEGAASYAQLPSGENLPAAIPAPPPVNHTPERTRDDRHVWKFGGQEYTLYWGDFHRHTDFSVCRTSDDGCIVEHFRYAYEATGLDYMATTDHTDHGKVYHEYEWWQSQKLADMFHNPDFFLAFYAYEREQKWPYGHRNVVFIERGAPIIYIKRENYANSRWTTPLPPPDGVREGEIPPWQLWKLLRLDGHRAITLEHTPAGGMGTDWSVYDQIDSKLENLVEIYQGSRASYEGLGAPQPAVAARGTVDFGKYAAGVYQNALAQGHKLGVFASSDHRSTNISFGGVYVKKFDRAGVFDAVDARHSIAATDKIFIEFSAGDQMLGDIFETSQKPRLTVSVRGTAGLKAVTIIRNERGRRIFNPRGSSQFDVTFTDDNPVVGENRYYVRVEQVDGNMGWTSPIWITFKP